LVTGVVCLGVEPPLGVGLDVAGGVSTSGSKVGSGVGSTTALFEFTFETEELSAFEFPVSALIPLSTVGSGEGDEIKDSSAVGSGDGATPAAPGPKFMYAQIPPPIPITRRNMTAIAPKIAAILPVELLAMRAGAGAA
jgi:hypothetical protein